MRARLIPAAVFAAAALAACASNEPRPDEAQAQGQAATRAEDTQAAGSGEAQTQASDGMHHGHGAAMQARCPMAVPGTRVDLEKGEGIEVILVFSNPDATRREALRERVEGVAERMEKSGVKMMAMKALAGGGEGMSDSGCSCGKHAEGKTCGHCQHHAQSAAASDQAEASSSSGMGETSAVPPVEVDAEVEAQDQSVRLVLTAQEEDHAGFLVDEMQWRVMKMQEGHCPMQGAR